jgi:hypothetical protein
MHGVTLLKVSRVTGVCGHRSTPSIVRARSFRELVSREVRIARALGPVPRQKFVVTSPFCMVLSGFTSNIPSGRAKMPTKKTAKAAKDAKTELDAPAKRGAKADRTEATAVHAAKRVIRRKVTLAERMGPTWDEIATRAYYLSEGRLRRGEGGSSETDWLEAERMLIREREE